MSRYSIYTFDVLSQLKGIGKFISFSCFCLLVVSYVRLESIVFYVLFKIEEVIYEMQADSVCYAETKA